MPWLRTLTKATLIGAGAGLVLLVVLNLGNPKVDELLVLLPIMAFELTVLYAVTLAVIYVPAALLLRRPSLVRAAALVLWPAPVVLVHVVKRALDVQVRPTLADELAFLAQHLGMSVPILGGLAIAGLVFARAVTSRGSPFRLTA